MTNSLRLEMADSGTQVLGVHVSYIDTDMSARVSATKNDPQQVASAVLSAREAGDTEVLVDEDSRRYKAAVAGPVDGLRLVSS